MQTATLPIRYAIYASGVPADTSSLAIVCSSLESEGGYYDTAAYRFSAGREVAGTISTLTSYKPLVGIRPALLFPATTGTTNRINLQVSDVNLYADGGSLRWQLLYYPPGTTNPVTGGTWAQANDASGVEVNVAGTALSLTGAYAIQSGYIGATGQTGRVSAPTRIIQTIPLTLDMSGANSPLTSNVGGNPGYIVLAALGVGQGATGAGSIDWEEIR
jgi:hypothetical protein